jgi:two-component system, LytTR family, response regulator
MKRIKVLIVDDERLARDEIRRHLQEQPDFEIAAEAGDAVAAAEMINSLKPDVVFLDVQMPGKSGFDLLESIEVVPQVIFTTAFDQYAVQAFEVNALDYLVKPVREERFAKAIEKIRERFTAPVTDTLFVKEGEQCYFIKLQDVSLIESLGNYARIHFKDKKVHIKRSLNQLEKILETTCFFRINRAEIINTNYITQIKPLPDGRLLVGLQTGKTCTASGRQSAAFKNRSIV